MVAFGQSFGGYLINYIQGQPLARKFKALTCEAGLFSTLSKTASTDELFFSAYHFSGFPEESPAIRAIYEKWDPARYVQNWKTPELVIHAEDDFRIPITEGIATFQALQRRGIESRFVRVQGEGHGILGREKLRVVYWEIIRWFGRFVGDDGEGRVQGLERE